RPRVHSRGRRGRLLPPRLPSGRGRLPDRGRLHPARHHRHPVDGLRLLPQLTAASPGSTLGTPMELTDLNANERLALVALIEATVRADHGVSREEEEVIAEIIDALGEGAYREAVEAADQRFKNESDLKAFLQGVQR